MREYFTGINIQLSQLQQIPSIKHRPRQVVDIQPFHTTQIYPVVSLHAHGLVKGIDAAFVAEKMLGYLVAELIAGQCIVFYFAPELLGRQCERQHHGTAADTVRTVAAEAGGDGFAFEGKTDGAAVTAAFVGLHACSCF